MSALKQWTIGVGVVIGCFGYECVPHGQSLNPKYFLSLFAQSSDAGAFASLGVYLMIAGVCIIVIGILIPPSEVVNRAAFRGSKPRGWKKIPDPMIGG